MSEDLDSLAQEARGGDRAALGALVGAVQGRLYNLSLRFLADADAAADATQDILVLIVTGLGSYRAESRFTTWAHRVAVNHLLTARKLRARDPGLSFAQFAADLESGLAPESGAEDAVLLDELRVGCTMAMLLCLTPPLRMAYVLGDIFEMDHGEAAEVAGTDPATHRQRLSRARAQVEAFTAQHCGVVSQAAACSCPRRLAAARKAGCIAETARLSRGSPGYAQVLAQVRGVADGLRTLTAQRAVPQGVPPQDFAAELDRLLTL